MTKIIFRFFIMCVIFTLLIAFLMFYIYKIIAEKDILKNINENTYVKFVYLDNYLQHYPPQQWQKIINALRPNNASIVNILPINKLPLNKDQIIQIQKGEFVYEYTKAKGYFPAVLYKKSQHPGYVYQEYIDFSDMEKGKRFFGWPPSIIIRELQDFPEKEWPNILPQLSKKYRLPLSIYELKDLPLSDQQKQQLLDDQWFFDTRESFFYLAEFIYIPISFSHKILVFGPLEQSFFITHSNAILFISALIIIEFIMFILTILFVRSLEKINLLANEYGQGKFDSSIQIKKTSVLFPLFLNLQVMGKRIKNLIFSHKELSHSISHELRTPLSRLHFSLELIKEDNENKKILNQIASMEDDIAELNELVSEILSYAKLDRLEATATIELKKYPIQEILDLAINKIKKSIQNKKLIINIQNTTHPIFIFANKKYILRVLQNLLLNAYRFANSTIQISLLTTNSSHCKLMIEDDGIGIPAKDRERAFEPFVQLASQPKNASRGYGLGLAITKKISDLHHWKIVLTESKLGGLGVIIDIPTYYH